METQVSPQSVLDSLVWGEPKEIAIRSGRELVKNAEPSEAFWDLWKAHKTDLQSVGITVSKFGGKFTVNWWSRNRVWASPTIVPGETELELVPDDIELEPLVNESGLKPWQPQLVRVVKTAMNKYGASLNACGTGVGKTFITLAAIRERGKKALIICPKTIVADWMRACHAMGVDGYVYGWEWIKTGKTPFGRWEVIPPKKPGGKSKRGDFIWMVGDEYDVVYDEAHRAAAMETQNSHIVLRAKAQGLNIHLLSATIANDPTKMRATGYVLDLHNGGKQFFDWMRINGVKEIMMNVGGGRRIKTYKFFGTAKDLKAIHKNIFPHRGVRVSAESLGTVFPPNQTIAKAFNMEEEEEIKAAYEEMKQKVAEIERQRNMGAGEKANCILVEILRARQKVELLKVPLLVSLTRDAREEGNSVFLAVNFKETIKELLSKLPEASIYCGLAAGKVILGKYDSNDRQNVVDNFQSNNNRIIIGMMTACREGLNLQDVHGGNPRVSYILPPSSPFALRQVLGRIWRSTGVTPSLQHIVYAANTIEEDVCYNLATKLDQLDLLMDGDLQPSIFPQGYSDMREEEED